MVARISIGVDLLDAVYEVVRRGKIQKGLILTGVGALQKAVFRNLKVFPQEYPVTPEDRIYFFEVERPLELLSLTGYIVPNLKGEPYVHAHFSASVGLVREFDMSPRRGVRILKWLKSCL